MLLAGDLRDVGEMPTIRTEAKRRRRDPVILRALSSVDDRKLTLSAAGDVGDPPAIPAEDRCLPGNPLVALSGLLTVKDKDLLTLVFRHVPYPCSTRTKVNGALDPLVLLVLEAIHDGKALVVSKRHIGKTSTIIAEDDAALADGVVGRPGDTVHHHDLRATS